MAFSSSVCAGRVLKLLVGQSQMVAISLVVWHRLYGVFEQRSSHGICMVMVVGPAQSIRGIGKFRQPFARRLCKTKGDGGVAIML